MNYKSRYISSAFLLLTTSVVVKVISAVYKIPLTAFIGGVGRGYFAIAYNLCLPIHAITMGAFPIALSRLVSKYNAVGDTSMVASLRRGSVRPFAVVGLVGMGVMLLLAVPYSRYIAGAPKSIYTILVLAPSILFSSLAASYRGYYEGFMDMVPTSVSQTLEAVIKLVFGLVFARLSMVYLLDYYTSVGYDTDSALAVIYPFTSAFAMLGVTFGAFVSMIFVWLYYCINHDKSVAVDRSRTSPAKRELLSFSFPIMVSSAVQSVFQFLDTASVQFSLGRVSMVNLSDYLSDSLSLANVDASQLSTYAYGLLSTAMDFKNLVPGITMALGVSAVPAVSSAFELGDKDRVTALVNSIYKYTVIIASVGGIALSLVSRDVLQLFYGGGSPDIVVGCHRLVSAFALTVPVYSLAGTAVFVVQAVGKPERSIASYVVSGIIRVVINVVLVSRGDFVLMGAVVSGAVGYAVLCVWNIVVAGVHMDVKTVVVRPAFVGVLSYFSARMLYSHMLLGFSLISDMLIKLSLFVAIYCILCFLCGLLNFRQIFCAIKLLKISSKSLKNG